MKILIVSGFLGAGKTTFIKAMAEKTGRDFVVMENEYGEAGIDTALLSQSDNLNIWELTEGCVCCTMKADFASSVLTIANTLDPEFLIVEPTGVGLLSNILQNIRQISYERITLLQPVTVLDADSFVRTHRMYGDLLTDQIVCAGTIVISKRSFASEQEAAPLLAFIRGINPTAEICFEHYSRREPSWWNSLLTAGLDGTLLPVSSFAGTEPDTFSLQQISLPGACHLLFFLEDLVRGAFGDIIRAKGFVQAGSALLRFDVAGDRYAVTGCGTEEPPVGTFIGTNIKRNLLRRLLLFDRYRPSLMPDRESSAGRKRRIPGMVLAPPRQLP